MEAPSQVVGIRNPGHDFLPEPWVKQLTLAYGWELAWAPVRIQGDNHRGSEHTKQGDQLDANL